MEPRWHEGIPPVEAIASHETEHYPIMGMPFCRITTARHDKPDRELKASQGKYGDWLVLHPEKFGLPAYPSTYRFREIEGEIFMQNGFSFWQPLAECRWAYECKYFPVGPDGLPTDYAALKQDAE